MSAIVQKIIVFEFITKSIFRFPPFVYVFCVGFFFVILTSFPSLKSEQGVNPQSNKGFLTMFIIPEWPEHRPIWMEDDLNWLLAQVEKVDEPQITLEQIQDNSEKFPIKFPIDSVRCKILSKMISKEILEKYINSVYPVLHENMLPLFCGFLKYKLRLGSRPERELYKNMTVIDLVDRILKKRAVVFLDAHDRYVLVDGTKGFGKWESIGTENETEKLNLQKCLSYDELKLSALLSVSSYTNFINDGNRHNQGVVKRANVEHEGIIIGLIGTRFEKPKVMEYAEIVISESQNVEGNGYGTHFAPTMESIFAGFYGEIPFVYSQALAMKNSVPNRFNEVEKGVLFDNNVYCKRITLSIETLLFEANQRAKEQSTTAYVHVVGLGLGVWKISPHQNALFLDTFAKRIESLGKHLHAISDIVFSHFGQNVTCGGYRDGEIIPVSNHPKNGIKVYLSNREPHVKLIGDDQGKLLVVSYAWDGNAFPGNEFWLGSLAGSGDPAAASSTQVAELHNAHINPKVSGSNLRIAGVFGVIPISKYRDVAQLSK